MKTIVGPAIFCALTLIAPTPIQGETVLADNFDDGNAAGWEEYDGLFSIDRGSYRIRSASSQNDARTVTGDTSWTDFQIQCDLKPLNCGRAGLLFRVADIGSGWGVGQYYELCLDSCSTATFYRVDGPSGPGTALATAACSIEANTWHHVQLDVIGESATATLDGETVLACDGLSEYPQGRVGLKTFRGGIALFDNVVVAAEPFPFSLSEIARAPLPTLRWDSAGPNCIYTVEVFVPEWGAWIQAPPTTQWPRRGLAWTDTSGSLLSSRGIYRVRAEKSTEPLPVGMSARFDGQDDWIEFPSVAGAFTSFTVEFWLRPESRADWNQSLGATGSWGRFAFHTTHAGAIYVGTDLATRFTPTDLPADTLVLGEWQHLAYVHDNGIGRFYRNGALLKSAFHTPPAPWQGFQCGAAAPDLTIDGDMDELRIYNRALDAPEIAGHYDGGAGDYGAAEPGLLGGWHFDEGTGTTAHDYSGHEHHGTLRNGAAWGEGLVQP